MLLVLAVEFTVEFVLGTLLVPPDHVVDSCGPNDRLIHTGNTHLWLVSWRNPEEVDPSHCCFLVVGSLCPSGLAARCLHAWSRVTVDTLEV